jgi:hypothetical protein
MECCVYWLFDETCSVPENDGYVGVSTNLPQRLREHKSKDRRKWSGVEVLFIGTRLECLEKEIAYRPFPGIGWNSNSGGTSGKMLAPQTRVKISRWQIGRKLPERTKAKMRAAHADRSPELRETYGLKALGNKSRTGQSWRESDATRAHKIGNKRSLGKKNALGHDVSTEAREALSRRMTGNTIRLGVTLSEQTKAKISASQRRRLALRKSCEATVVTGG